MPQTLFDKIWETHEVAHGLLYVDLHLVHEVQVDVKQAVGDLVRLPDLVEQRLWHLASPQSGGDDREKRGVVLRGVLKVVGKIGVEGHAIALTQRIALPVADE